MQRSLLTVLVVAFAALLSTTLAAGPAAAVCGDSILDPGEMCDPPDGNCCLLNCTCDAGQTNLCGPVCFGGTSSCQQRPSGCPCIADPHCPLDAGTYTLTTTGGILVVGNNPGVPLATGGTTVLEVGLPDANCVHPVVIPPGGYNVPQSCVLGFLTSASTQSGCGTGLLDSDGGSDFTIVEIGDTSSPVICGLPQGGSCLPGADESLQINVTRGDGIPDPCPTGGVGNLLTSIPISTLSWVDVGGCPAPDGTYDPGLGDVLVSALSLTIDNTTHMASADWADLDPDSCCLAAAPSGGPASPPCGTSAGYASMGACLDFPLGTVTTAASAPIASPTGLAGFDLTFTATSIQSFAPSGPPGGSTCGPVLPVGTSTRCVP